MKDKIINAAKKLFLTKGYEKTTMRDIVKSAETSIGNCYFYYKNKEAILKEIVISEIDEFEKVLEKTIEPITDVSKKIAIAMYTDIMSRLDESNFDCHFKLFIISLQLPSIRTYIFDTIKKYFEKLVPIDLIKQDEIQLVLTTYLSSSFFITESYFKKEIPLSPHKIALFITKWNLKAFGMHHKDVEESIKYLNELNKAEIWKKYFYFLWYFYL